MNSPSEPEKLIEDDAVADDAVADKAEPGPDDASDANEKDDANDKDDVNGNTLSEAGNTANAGKASEQIWEKDWDISKFDVAESDEHARFHDFSLPLPMMRAIADLGFEYCTPIQSASLPISLADYDITGQAQTGTGKTAAFLITIMTRLWEQPLDRLQARGEPRALILAPTRELALQIEADGESLAKYMDISVQCLVGGMDFDKQQRRLEKRPVDILVATPGRLIDFCNRRWVNLKQVEVLVIDEADRMLDMGFIPDVRRIVYQTPHKRVRQTLFFSATFNDEVMRLANSWTMNPEHVVIEPDQVATDNVEQKFWMIEASTKVRVLAKVLETEAVERALVFTNRRDSARRVKEALAKKNVRVEILSGEVPQNKRLSTLEKFRSGEVPVVVATDVAGRGIHVDGVSHVFNFDLPEDPEDYVHRIGRTGRAGAEGIAISFVSEDDGFCLPAIEEYLGTKVECSQPDFSVD
ncbi:MAG: DEAD/DEAH box helicase [Pseudomonadaceae bacterium]|nr:DEAD/DEAH box helicase [Pseudomonadaceae bacterium]